MEFWPNPTRPARQRFKFGASAPPGFGAKDDHGGKKQESNPILSPNDKNVKAGDYLRPSFFLDALLL